MAGRPSGLLGEVEYATDLFDRETVERLGSRLVRILEAVARDPDALIGSIDLLDAQERRQVLVDWNATSREVGSATLPGAVRGAGCASA